jgi:HK97 family phage portal protein
MSWWNGWRRWLGLPLGATDRELYDVLGSGETWAGEPPSVAAALKLSAFWAGVRVTAETVASLSFDIMERTDKGKVRVADHELQGLLDASPNADQTAVEFWEGRVLGLCTSGNGFAEKVTRAAGALVALNPMPSDTVAERTQEGALRYRFIDRGKEVILPEEKVFHVKAFGEGDMGWSPVAFARQGLSLALATEKAAGHAYSRGLRTKGFFVMPAGAKMLTPEQRTEAKKSLVEANTGPNAPWAGILEGGVEFKPVSLSMRDAEMILNRRFNVEDVCRWIGVPPIVIGHAAEGQTMWGTGVSAIMQSWYTLRLRTILKRIEQAIEKRIFTPAQRLKFSVKINYEDLLRGDTKARAAFYVALLNAGVLTINEVRELEGRAPIEGGDVSRMQSQNVPITQTDSIGHNGGPPLGDDE